MNKYRTFDQLYEDVSVDFASYTLEGFVDPAQLIKVAIRVNYDLGLKIHKTKDTVLEIEHGKALLPLDFAYLNYAFRCGSYTVSEEMPCGTTIETFNPVPYVPSPNEVSNCETTPTCNNVCVIQNCNNQYQLIHRVGGSLSYRVYNMFIPLKIKKINKYTCDCFSDETADDIAEIRDGYIYTSFTTGKVYINYQGAMEDTNGNLLVLDHPYCNEYYEYALKQRILENMLFDGENVTPQLTLIEQRLRAARNNALTYVNTPDFKEMQNVWQTNRKAQYHNYYSMFKS